jgi:molybdenum cofactor cytidylyltransferase
VAPRAMRDGCTTGRGTGTTPRPPGRPAAAGAPPPRYTRSPMAAPPPAPPAGVVLAAGASSRMGEDKLLLPFAGEPLVRRAVRVALEAGLSPVVVVLGPEGARARAALAGLDCRLAVNPDPGRGQGSSLSAGIAALPPGVPAAVVLLGDMPRVTAAMIAAVAARWRETGVPLVLSDYGGTTAPPALYARPLLEELLAAEGEQPGKQVAARHGAEAARVAWPAGALADVDTPADLAAARAAEGGWAGDGTA